MSSLLSKTPLKRSLKSEEHLIIPRSITEAVTPTTSHCLDSVPGAPKKKRRKPSLAERRGRLEQLPKLRFDEDEVLEDSDVCVMAHALLDTGRVASKWQQLVPQDVAYMDDEEELKVYEELYYPVSQPRNIIEQCFVDLMRRLIRQRINYLCSSPSP